MNHKLYGYLCIFFGIFVLNISQKIYGQSTEFTTVNKTTAQVQSSGGQFSSGGEFSNFAVIGELVVAESLQGGIYANTAGYVFLENSGNTSPLDSMVLIHFMSATSGDKWSIKWDTRKPVREWYGVKMEGNKVVEMNLSNNNLQGSLSSLLLRFDTAFIMSELKILKIAGNHLKGSISANFFGMKKLEVLDLDNNELTEIPNAVNRLQKLTTLWLSRNQLEKLPDSLAYLPNIRSLFLNDNKLEKIPNLSGDAWKSLTILDLSGNKFTQMPDFIAKLTNLNELRMANNSLKEIPSDFSALKSLEKLDLSNNLLTHAGTIGQMRSIRELTIHSNKLGFEHLEPLVSNQYRYFSYAPQGRRGSEEDILVQVEQPFQIWAQTSSSSTRYQWTKDNEVISASLTEYYRISSFQKTDIGTYVCASTNPLLPDLTIFNYPIRLRLNCGAQIQAKLSTKSPTEFCDIRDISALLELTYNASNAKIEWYENDARLAFVGENSYRAKQFASYKALVTDANGCSAYSNNILITKKATSTIKINYVRDQDLLIPVSSEKIKIFRWYYGEELLAEGLPELKVKKEGRYRFEGYTEQGCLLLSDNFDVSSITANQSADLEEKAIRFYPNPTPDLLTIETNRYFAQTELKIDVTDLMGRRIENIETKRLEPFRYQINMAYLPTGSYFVRLSDGKGYELIHKILKK